MEEQDKRPQERAFESVPPDVSNPADPASPEATMASAMEAEALSPQRGPDPGIQLPEGPFTVQPAEFAQLSSADQATRKAANIDLLLDVSLPVSIELGRTRMSIADILELGSGSIVELDKLAGEPVDILVNNKPLAKGEVVVLDENFGVRITSLVSPRERLERLKS
jgi:flagellar motor switch protein FliN/FliY